MASLQKIRNHGPLVIVIVGVAMLAFVLGDTLTHADKIKNRDRDNVGVIAGEKVSYSEYEVAKTQLEEVYKMQFNRDNLEEEMQIQIQNDVWNSFVQDYSLRAEFEKIGMDLTQDELTELCLGENPHSIIRSLRLFRDENGAFNRDYVASLNSFIHSADADQNPNAGRYRNYWYAVQRLVRVNYMQEKYNALLQHLLKANSLEAEFAYNNRQKGISAQYVMQPYFAVADSLVKVSESDIKALYKKHKEQYKQEPTRAIQYITIAKNPSEADFQAEKERLENLQEAFRTAEDVTVVVNPNSDIMYDGRDYSAETVPAQFKEFAFGKNAKAGDCTDILFDGATYSMARIMKAGYSAPDSVELKIVVEDGDDIELGWYTQERLINERASKDLIEKAFAGKRGKQFTISMGMGEQTFEIMEVAKATPKVQLAIISRTVTASSRTNSAIFNEATQFAMANSTYDALVEAAQEAGYTLVPQYGLTEMTRKVGNLSDSRQIVKWAFEAKEGEVSPTVFLCGDNYVIAALIEVNDSEYRPLEAVRAELNYEASNNAKAKYIAEQLAGVESLDAAAAILGTPIQSVERVSLADSRFGNAGMEPAVIGATLALGENQLSEPIQGLMGVYMVKTGAALNTAEPFDAESEKQQVSRYSYMHYQQALRLLEDETEIKDNRARFQ